jgi:hypothetical protein
MRFNVSYTGAGGTLDMSTAPILYREHDFMSRKHNYNATALISGRGSKLTRFYKEAVEYTIQLSVWGADMHATLNNMTDIFERDIFLQQPGRLQVNEEYLNCYVIASEVGDWTLAGNGVTVELTILAEKPLWIREELLSYGTFTAGSSTGFILPTAIPFALTSSAGIRQLIVEHHASVLAEISLFGPSVNPSFNIGSHLYQINGTLLAGERFVINQLDKTVIKVTNSGEVINCFNLRSKTSSVFEPIPAGENILTYTGEFAISINLFYERGEPQWS